jgi:hypothetical protein
MPPESHPPETEEVDSAWLGDLSDDLDSAIAADASRRDTRIPSIPAELYAAQAMQAAITEPAPAPTTHHPRDLRDIEKISFSPEDFGIMPEQLSPPKTAEAEVRRAPSNNELRRAPSNTALGFVDAYVHTSPPPATPTLKISTVPPPKVSDSATDMHERFALGDYSGALSIAESILEKNPGNDDAKRYAQSCREVLTQMYAARLGPLDQMVSVAVSPEQIRWLSLDHRGGFVLSLVDGSSTVEEILDISGMPRLEALRIMYTLAQQKIVVLS